MLRAFRINLFALAGVALLVGVFLVYNTVLISILRRSADVGVLKTLGTSPRQLFVAFIGEGAVFGVTGSLLGIALGYGLAYGTLGLIGRTINALYVTTSPSEIVLTPGLVAAALILGTAVSVVSAVQPAMEAAAIRPNLLIRAGIYQRTGKPRVLKAGIAALVLFFLGAAASQLPPIRGIAAAGYVAVAFVVAGFAAISPLAILYLSKLARRPFGTLFLMPGTLAAASLPASLRRVAVAAAALSIAIGMMVAVSMMVGSFRETVRAWVDQTVRSDLWIRPAKELGPSPGAVFPASISDELQSIEEIELFDRIRMREVVFRDTLISVGGGDFAQAAKTSAMPMVRPRSQRQAVAEALRIGGVLISESLSLKFDIDVGDEIELPVAGGTSRFPVTGIYRDYSNDRGVVVMDRAAFIRAYDDDTIDTIAIFLRDGVDPARARSKIERTLGAKYRVFAFTNASIRSEVMKIFDQTFLITYALLVVAIAVAVLGIVNTLSALIIERRREIALLKVLGMSRPQIRRMILLECSLLGIVSTILGLACGFVLSWILIFVINKQSFGWTIEFAPPGVLIATSLAITLLATIIAGIYPARMAGRLAMSSALKGE
jgi:putative ABC transport system permease protein